VELEGEMLNSLANLYKSKVNRELASSHLTSSNVNGLSLIAQSSIFANKASATNFVNNPDKLKLDADKLRQFSLAVIDDNRLQGEKFKLIDEEFAKNTRVFIAGLMKSMPEKKFYPDANSTMRLTYGTIEDLPMRSDRNYYGVTDNYYTDMAGLVAKFKKDDEEFDLPQKLIDLYNAKDFGQYADAKGYMPINFLSNNDITGGNSGSPIIDADGNLIGLAFDGNSEALSGDIVFEKEWQRTINLDVRYALWIMDKYAGANKLVKELKLVKDENTPKNTKKTTVTPEKKKK
jgi:hypothetical protein